jgi:hypothetical protein
MSVHSCLARLEEWLARGSRNEDLFFPAHFIAIAAPEQGETMPRRRCKGAL